ncbi:MAG: DUF1289 domain-containing protein [Bacteroidales bacterium]|nr:DUF1289 domain-containing protein [Bacteroidales bacterium]MCF8458988.1 DUF1289 domain-containing protein [Bacteroidales bacterium]
MEEVKSPCIKVCQHDSQGICFGCRRTVDEAGNWSSFSNDEKFEIIQKTRARRNAPGEMPGGFLR